MIKYFFILLMTITLTLSGDIWDRFLHPFDKDIPENFKHTIKSASEEIIELEDGSAWQLTKPEPDVWNIRDGWVLQNGGYDWQNGDEVVFFHMGTRRLLLNMRTHEAEIITQKITPSDPELSRYIVQITKETIVAGIPIRNTIELDDGSTFHISWVQYQTLEKWSVGDQITLAFSDTAHGYGSEYVLINNSRDDETLGAEKNQDFR